MVQRKRHGGAFKARVAVEAIAGRKTVNEIAGAYEIHPSQVAKWKAEALKQLPEVLSDGRKSRTPALRSATQALTKRCAGYQSEAEAADSQVQARLYEEIGRLTMEAEYLKKKLGLCPSNGDEG